MRAKLIKENNIFKPKKLGKFAKSLYKGMTLIEPYSNNKVILLYYGDWEKMKQYDYSGFWEEEKFPKEDYIWGFVYNDDSSKIERFKSSLVPLGTFDADEWQNLEHLIIENIGGAGGAGYAVYGGGWGRSFGNPSLGTRFAGRGFGFGGSANLSGGPNLMYTYSVKPLSQELQQKPTPQDGEETIHTGCKIKGKILNTNKDIEGKIIHIEEDHDNNVKYYLVLDPEDGIQKKVDPTSAFIIKPEEYVDPFTEDQPVEETYKSLNFYPSLTEKLSASEALYGFGGWLTTRDKPVTMSTKHNAAIVAELISEFVEKQKLEEPKDRWEKDLVPMKEEFYPKLKEFIR